MDLAMNYSDFRATGGFAAIARGEERQFGHSTHAGWTVAKDAKSHVYIVIETAAKLPAVSTREMNKLVEWLWRRGAIPK